jgi:hypothetical protein
VLVRFPSRAKHAAGLKGPAPIAPGQRARRVGAWILIVGLGAAGLLYVLETRRAEPGIEQLPGYSAANSRQMGVFYGHAGEVMWGWRETLAEPATQAGIVLAVAAVAAGICFRIAWLDVQHAKEHTEA